MPDEGESTKELAKVRTDLAEHRTAMANERTYAGWIRTALACVGVGLGLHALLGDYQPAWLAKLVASAFIATGVILILFAHHHAKRILDQLKIRDVPAMPHVHMLWITLALIAAATGAGALLLFL